MHIYAFGSVCRGEVTCDSDFDLLAITVGHDPRFDPNLYSIYSYERLQEIWLQGNPFAWHLWLESKVLYSDDGGDYLKSLGSPSPYASVAEDCEKFASLFCAAKRSVLSGTNSFVFELSTVFLAVRNFATCFSLGSLKKPDFSRNSALRLGIYSLSISKSDYDILERARILCTRGTGAKLSNEELSSVVSSLDGIDRWMYNLLEGGKCDE